MQDKNIIRDYAYDRYKMMWMYNHGYGFSDINVLACSWSIERQVAMNTNDRLPKFDDFVEECGFSNGDIWACFDEFLTNEYMDDEYMRLYILPEDKYHEYLEDVKKLRLENEEIVYEF